MIQWLVDNWEMIAAPALVFLGIWAIGLWLRRVVYGALASWQARSGWEDTEVIVRTTRHPFLLWFLLLALGVAVQVSDLPVQAKATIGQTLGTLFAISFFLVFTTLTQRLLRLYLPKTGTPERAVNASINVARVAIAVVGLLIILDIWGAPTTPVFLLILIAAAVAILGFRTVVPNLFSGFQLSASQRIRAGDYVKIETGEEGYVTDIGWSNTGIQALDGSTVFVPNSRFFQHTVINYGRPLKKAREPFMFMSRTYLKELTGLKAKNLSELVATLEHAPDPVVDYHTHRFLEEHNYLTPGPANDFAVWVTDALGDEVLGERLASVDPFSSTNLGDLREKLVCIIEEYQATNPDSRQAMEGREFHFMKSVSVVVPTTLVVHDLREFIEALRKVSTGSLYFHIFESRLRLGKGLNDFSAWLKDNLDEAELGDEIARLDPYTYNLEGLRSALIQLIEKRIK